MRKPETKFRQDHVIPFLKTLRHTVAFPIQQLTICGDPDFMLCCHGRFVALELKKEGETAEPLQTFKLSEVERTHGVSIVASPDNWGEVKTLLSLIDAGGWDD